MASKDGKFVVQFIAEAASKNMEAIDAAKQEIEEIDVKLRDSEILKVRRMKLMYVLEHFGDETYRRRRLMNTPSSDDIDDNSPELDSIKEKIKVALKEQGPMHMRELIRAAVDAYDQDYLVIRAVKWLGENDVITRDEEQRIAIKED